MITIEAAKINDETHRLAKRHRELYRKSGTSSRTYEEIEEADKIFVHLYNNFTCKDCKHCQMLKNDSESYNLYCHYHKAKFTGLFILKGCFDPIEIKHKSFQLF